MKGLEDSYLDDQKKNAKPQEETIQIGEQIIRSRGRGTKRALQLRFSSDEESEAEAEEGDKDKMDADSSEVPSSKIIDDSILDSPPPSPPKKSDNFRTQVLGSK